MAYQITISILCAIIAGIARAVSNKIIFHYRTSVFRYRDWFNPEKSWRNKWKLVEGNPLKVNGKLVDRITFAASFILATMLLTTSNWFAFSYLVIYMIFAGTFHIFFTYFFTRQPKEHKNPNA